MVNAPVRLGLSRKQRVPSLHSSVAKSCAQSYTDKDAYTKRITRTTDGNSEAEGERQLSPKMSGSQRKAAVKAAERLREDSDPDDVSRRQGKKKSSSGQLGQITPQPPSASKRKDVQFDASPLSSSDDEEDDRRRHADIRASKFASQDAGVFPKSAGPNEDTGRVSQTKRSAKSVEPVEVAKDRPSRRPLRPSDPKIRPAPHNKNKPGYGAKAIAMSAREVEKRKKRGEKMKDNSQAPDTPCFHAPVTGDSENETVESPRKRLKLPGTKKPPSQKSSPVNTFNASRSRREPARKASPLRTFKPPERTRGRDQVDKMSLSSPAKSFRTSKDTRGDDAMSTKQVTSPLKAFHKPRGIKRANDMTSPEQTLSPTKPFKNPSALSSSFSSHSHREYMSPSHLADEEPFNRLDSSSPLTDVDSDVLVEVPDNVCPLCSAPVDAEMLANFVKEHGRMRFNDKQKFCRSHQLRGAREAWKDRGYPDIDWQKLEWRIQKHSDFLRAVVEGGESFYRDALGKMVVAGQAKTVNQVFKAGQSITPGYYGLRGLSFMSDHIVRLFNALLRERAVEDKLVSARGFATFVQSVLVPELTVKLIMEDMNVEQEKARAIMQESMSLGEILNGEVVDTGKNDDDDDTSSLSELSD